MNKKGQSGIGSLGGVAIAFVIVAIVLSLGATVLSDFQADQTVDSQAYNSTGV